MKAMNPFNDRYFTNTPELVTDAIEAGNMVRLLDFVKVPVTVMLSDNSRMILSDDHLTSLELFIPTTGSEFVDELFKLNTLVSYRKEPYLIVNFDLKERIAYVPRPNYRIDQIGVNSNVDKLILTSRNLMLNNIQLCPSDGTFYSPNEPYENCRLIPDELEAAVRKALENGIKCGMTELVFGRLQFQVRVVYDRVIFISPTGYQSMSCLVTEDIGEISSFEEFIQERKVDIINRINNMTITMGDKSYIGSECIDKLLEEATPGDFTCSLGNSFITITKDEMSCPQLRDYLTYTLFAYIVSGRLDSRLIESKPCKNPHSNIE